MPVSTYINGEYGHSGMFIGVPAIINRKGVKEILELKLEDKDQEKFDNSCNVLNEMIENSINPIIEND